MGFPLQNARTRGGSLGLRDVAGSLEGDRESGVGERVLGRENRESHCGGDGLVELTGVAESPDQAVMRLDMAGVGGNGGAKGVGCGGWVSGGKQFEAVFAMGVGGIGFAEGHGCH